MVSTRASSRAASAAPETPPPPDTPRARRRPSPPKSKQPKTPRKRTAAAVATAPSAGAWYHVPSRLTLAWLLVSLPLVAWDTGYVLGRPATMAGGWLHAPLWVPYRLYGNVDHIYGWKAWHTHNGFTAAQSSLNIVESLMYVVYLCIVFSRRTQIGVDAAAGRATATAAAVTGRAGALAALIGFSASVMTVSKTVLYWLNEYWSGYANVGHNTLRDLIILWVIPNGAWLVLPTYMIWAFGSDILYALELASSAGSKSALSS